MHEHRRASGDRGATSVEYALIASLIAVVVLIGVFALGQGTLALFDSSASEINEAVVAE
jgi:Flp pilus assembly pilin Flp